jgi:hypothetical protein
VVIAESGTKRVRADGGQDMTSVPPCPTPLGSAPGSTNSELGGSSCLDVKREEHSGSNGGGGQWVGWETAAACSEGHDDQVVGTWDRSRSC